VYTEGIKIGDNSYILSDEDGNLTLLSGSDNQEKMEEYIKLDNQYEEKLEERNELREKISYIHELDKKSRKANIEIIITAIFLEGLFILLGALSLELPKILTILIGVPLGVTGIGNLGKIDAYGTNKKRTKTKNKIKNEIEKVNEELKEIKLKMDTLKEKMEYSEIDLYEDEIIPVTTVENKKANVKMRVLRLEYNR